MDSKIAIELWQKYLSIYGKHYEYDCLCEYCRKTRECFPAWFKEHGKKWCEHISMSGSGVWCYNGFETATWNFCPKCGAIKPE